MHGRGAYDIFGRKIRQAIVMIQRGGNDVNRKKRKIKNALFAVVSIVMVFGFTTQAATNIQITQKQRLILAGTSGSVWKNEAKGQRTSSSTGGYLYSGIKKNSSSAISWGNGVGGNKVQLTAYSPAIVGVGSEMVGTAKAQ